jgi:hypothetical protein
LGEGFGFVSPASEQGLNLIPVSIEIMNDEGYCGCRDGESREADESKDYEIHRRVWAPRRLDGERSGYVEFHNCAYSS